MPLLRSLTLKIKTKLTPLASPPSPGSPPASFEVVGARRTTGSDAASDAPTTKGRNRTASFLSDDGVSLHTNLVLDMVSESEESEKEDRKEKRRSRFREEFGDAEL